jgi:hypothetical protein
MVKRGLLTGTVNVLEEVFLLPDGCLLLIDLEGHAIILTCDPAHIISFRNAGYSSPTPFQRGSRRTATLPLKPDCCTQRLSQGQPAGSGKADPRVGDT